MFFYKFKNVMSEIMECKDELQTKVPKLNIKSSFKFRAENFREFRISRSMLIIAPLIFKSAE